MSPHASHLRPLLLLTVTLATAAGAIWMPRARSTAPQQPAPQAEAVVAAPDLTPVTAPSAPATTPSPREIAPPAASAIAPASAGMRAYLDPETGTIGPMPANAAEAAALDAVAGELPDPIEVRLPDGSVMLDLQGHMQEYYVVQLDANGKRVVRCVSDPKLAQQAPPAPAPQPEER